MSVTSCSSLRASRGSTSSKNSIAVRTMSTECRSAMRLARSCGTTSKACMVKPTVPSGSRIHSTKLLIAVWTTSATLARCEASRSVKNGSRSSMTCTASVDRRPEYCLIRCSSASGTSARSRGLRAARNPRGAVAGLSGIPKRYPRFLVGNC
ncbi:Uncharacterised protein [Mycobacteroides abscessus subsp. abscessus]|nr:Uncharacterised protein [Mycobacteroides abscessus subsp. abscessus]SHV13091.1 Uncharacterised protein [Mycobacteroides abscessus subsp. abscessus]SIB42376.1 Uncharacterised protein [Mycobacteroides abscessus subsp. abscessus]SKL45565.1 Uncharacterised protein [Mycobacteroides abscessus subsp. abscessus]